MKIKPSSHRTLLLRNFILAFYVDVEIYNQISHIIKGLAEHQWIRASVDLKFFRSWPNFRYHVLLKLAHLRQLRKLRIIGNGVTTRSL